MSQHDLMTLYQATPAHTFFSFAEWVAFVGDVQDTQTILSWFKDSSTIH